ncbi:MAG: hypothetical protein ACK5SI_07700, partial [Planctomycetia bacterium]
MRFSAVAAAAARFLSAGRRLAHAAGHALTRGAVCRAADGDERQGEAGGDGEHAAGGQEPSRGRGDGAEPHRNSPSNNRKRLDNGHGGQRAVSTACP